MCNNKDRFKSLRPLNAPEYLRARDSVVAIEGYGTITIHARTSSGGQALPITLHDVTYVLSYHTSLVSYYTLNEKSGAYLNAKHLLIRTADDAPYYVLTRAHKQFVLEYNKLSGSAFALKRSAYEPKPSGTGLQWHHRLGHPSPKVIKNLPKGVKVIDPSNTPSTTKYEPYALIKAVNVVSRRLTTPPKHPFKRVNVDWF